MEGILRVDPTCRRLYGRCFYAAFLCAGRDLEAPSSSAEGISGGSCGMGCHYAGAEECHEEIAENVLDIGPKSAFFLFHGK